jgi:hypothetical protein
MSFYDILSMAHGGMGILLLLLAMISVSISVLIAVKPAADQAHEGLVNKANFVGLIEMIVAGFMILSGVIAVVMSSWSFSQLWLWLSLMIMVFYISALQWATKPSRMAVAEGGSHVKSGMQVVLQMAHVLLLFGAFALMYLKPI